MSETSFLCFTQQRQKNLPITGSALDEKVLSFHKRLMKENPTAQFDTLDRSQGRTLYSHDTQQL
jgi:hypothetical protein